jgi:hypothetical protein
MNCFSRMAFRRIRIRPPVQTIFWFSFFCLWILEPRSFVEESPSGNKKRPSHHFSEKTPCMSSSLAQHVNKKVQKKGRFSGQDGKDLRAAQ